MIYTSRYSNPELKSGKYTTVRISLGTPKWNIGFHLDAEMPDLMPFGLLGKFDTESAFRPAYFKRLDRIGTQRIFKQLQRLEANGKDVVLLCSCKETRRYINHNSPSRAAFAVLIRGQGRPQRPYMRS